MKTNMLKSNLKQGECCEKCIKYSDEWKNYKAHAFRCDCHKEMTPNKHIEKAVNNFQVEMFDFHIRGCPYDDTAPEQEICKSRQRDMVKTQREILLSVYQAGQDSVRINNACSNPVCPTRAQRIANEMCPCRIAAQDEQFQLQTKE